MLREFRQFLMRGSVLDLAVGIVIGVAFGTIITSFVGDILMPPIGLLLGNMDFSNLYINLSGGSYDSLAAARAAGAAVIAYGSFINTIINFVIIAFAVFLIVYQVGKMRKKPEKAVTTRDCPFCYTTIPIKATRCPNCTSELKT